MFVSQVVSDAAVLASRRADGPIGPEREEARGPGLRARATESWRRMTTRQAPQQVICADCSA
jgi:hypothetical protein